MNSSCSQFHLQFNKLPGYPNVFIKYINLQFDFPFFLSFGPFFLFISPKQKYNTFSLQKRSHFYSNNITLFRLQSTRKKLKKFPNRKESTIFLVTLGCFEKCFPSKVYYERKNKNIDNIVRETRNRRKTAYAKKSPIQKKKIK